MTTAEAQEGFMADLQIVLNKWSAELEPNYDGGINVTVFSPLYCDSLDDNKPYTVFEAGRLWPS